MNLNRIFLGIVCACMLASCSKFLDKPYDNRLELKNVGDYEALVSQAYPERQDLFTDILTDDYHHYGSMMEPENRAVFLPLYLWESDYLDGIGTPSASYSHYYHKIYLANTVIEEVMNSTGSGLEKKAILGEALMIRAYCYFSLVNLFGMHFNPQTSGSDLGVPLVTSLPRDNKPTFNRNTVKEVYNQIDKDMLEGLSLVKEGSAFLSRNPYRFNLGSIFAFFSRVNLYKGNWEESIKYADAAVQYAGVLVRDLSNDLHIISTKSIEEFALEFMNPSTHRNILLASQTGSFVNVATGHRRCGFYPVHELYDQIPQQDLRSQLYQVAGTALDSIMVYTKYATQPNSVQERNIRTECFTTEEVLLNRAEANLKKTNPDLPAAIRDLETIRLNRISPYVALKTAGLAANQILNLVMQERRLEFLGQGIRWFDVKRLGIKVEHRLIRTSLAPTQVLMPNDKRTAIQIPLSARIGNPVLENQLNPR